jgi:hypothetical protein
VASLSADRDALLPVPEVFRFIALDGTGTYETSNQQARASLLFPGNGLILGPSLVCGTFGKEFPPEFGPILDTCMQYQYPLTVYADGFEPDGATAGALALGDPADPVSGNAVGARAHAGEDAVTTDAAMQDLSVTGLPPFGPVTPPIPGFELDSTLLTFDAATSRTDQRIIDGRLVVEAEATLSGVRMIGGLLEIGALRSRSHVVDDGGEKPASDAVLEVSGVTVAGVPAQITHEGLVIGSPAGGLGPLAEQVQSQVNELVRAHDLRVSILDAEETTDESGAAVASVGGLLVEFSRDVQDLPTVPGPIGDIDANGLYRGTIQLGSTAALGGAASFDDAVPDDVGDLAGLGDAGTGPGIGDTGATGDLGAPEGDAGAVPAPDAAASAAGGGATGGDEEAGGMEEQPVSFVDELFADRLELLYLSFTLAALALCIAPRLTLPARFPGSRP